jgi:hypothetical protein
VTRYRALQPRDAAWHKRCAERTAELLAILDRAATPQELADALVIVSAPRETPQPSILCGRQGAA